MRLGVLFDPHAPDAGAHARRLEELGVASVWVPEVWGYDALTGLAHVAAQTTTIGLGTFVVQLGARSPALLATSALSLQSLSGGRFTLGVGVSGPQVMEGWHGVRFTRPVQTTRETVEIIRTVSRGERLVHDGVVYPLPLPDSEGRALRPLVAPAHVPVHIAAMGPANLRLTGEVADGWLGNAFVPEAADVVLDALGEGAAAAGRTLADLDLVAPVAVELTDDPAATDAAVVRHARGYAFTIGAMGSGGRNFYNDAFGRLGYADDVARVQERWRSGDREGAAAAVPLDLGRLTNLIGSETEVAERLALHASVGITTILAKLDGGPADQLSVLERLVPLLPG
ncbi:LLM class flavin-dependent oxidoreductase [Iamia sp. SCSIO 61187]|uniref:LLM class flavin-dependent oxidoreductase n=1 Tax=Iamia sp. SCSIO 61187 TaxID=2722752 RepID=UPI001C6348CD|nr:LLM class flavin-dependent oxidoreductase [Iamia sp. SCSIO 61187]QYG91016.1 LLM class flavin-dependent oxidoreductase [Iamia sp. SCSIO 61187]